MLHVMFLKEDVADVETKLEAKVEHDAVLKDGNEQHDAKACEHAYVLQDKVSQLAAFVTFTITMQHLRQLFNRRKFTSVHDQ